MPEVRIESPGSIRLVRLPRVAANMDRAIEKGLRLAGFYLEGVMKKKARGRPGPMVRTGGAGLRARITSQMTDGNKGVKIGSNVPYAIFVELGTRFMHGPGPGGGYPFVQPAFEEGIDKAIDILEREIMRPF